MRTCLRLGSLGFLAVSVACLVLGVRASARGRDPGLPSLRLREGVRNFGQLPEGGKMRLAFRLINEGDVPRHVLGAGASCGNLGCVGLRSPASFRFEVPPRSHRDLEVEVTARKAGALEESMALFTDDPGQFEVRLTVRGRVVPASAQGPGPLSLSVAPGANPSG